MLGGCSGDRYISNGESLDLGFPTLEEDQEAKCQDDIDLAVTGPRLDMTKVRLAKAQRVHIFASRPSFFPPPPHVWDLKLAQMRLGRIDAVRISRALGRSNMPRFVLRVYCLCMHCIGISAAMDADVHLPDNVFRLNTFIRSLVRATKRA